jgi:hypothetical protein
LIVECYSRIPIKSFDPVNTFVRRLAALLSGFGQ